MKRLLFYSRVTLCGGGDRMEKVYRYFTLAIFFALLIVVTMEIAFNLRMQVESYDFYALLTVLRILGILGILERVFIVILFGIFAFTIQQEQ